MRESDMQTLFGKYLRQNSPNQTEVYELKISRGPSLPFNSLQDHQAKALLEVETGFFHKLTDPPIFYGGKMRFNVPRPFDCLYVKKALGFVVLWFYHPREQKVFIKIPIKEFLHERDISTRKSITEIRALEIGIPMRIILHDNE